jgi:arginyl-tRNA synthetase
VGSGNSDPRFPEILTLSWSDEERSLAEARLLLFTMVKRILVNGLAVLGIRPIEKM